MIFRYSRPLRAVLFLTSSILLLVSGAIIIRIFYGEHESGITYVILFVPIAILFLCVVFTIAKKYANVVLSSDAIKKRLFGMEWSSIKFDEIIEVSLENYNNDLGDLCERLVIRGKKSNMIIENAIVDYEILRNYIIKRSKS